MIKKTLILLVISFTALSQSQNKILTLQKIDDVILIDGEIDEVWNLADSTSDFFQLLPYYGQPTPRRTVAKVLTGSQSLYCLMICCDEERNIQRTTGTLDEFAGDVVSIMLDTFNDRKTAYKFAVSASGVKSDSRMLDDGRNRDYSWDGIWHAASKIYDWGFAVEIEVPYKSIQYHENSTSWGLDFDRWSQASTEDLYWCIYDQNEGLRISKFGQLVFENFTPTVKGLNLEIYPVGILKSSYIGHAKYDIDPNAGLDIFYNPSPKLTYQLTVNPDFAQIEADPFDFNITRYETYFSERRPFFTEGNEIFMASGKQRGSGFYSPLELFYSRRIGKKLPDGSEVPLIAGTKAFGRADEWEYGGFLALTGEKRIRSLDVEYTEPQALFGSARIKKQILGNSSLGILFVGKKTSDNTYGVVDIDGAFRQSDWQLAYQFARSIKNEQGDFAASAGFSLDKQTWMTLARLRYVGENFDVDEIGFVPWKGTAHFTGVSGPVWYFDEGFVRQATLFAGISLVYEKVDDYVDHNGIFGINLQFRDNWGCEIITYAGTSKDRDYKFTSYRIDFSSWFHTSPRWQGSMWWSCQSKTYNFKRNYVALFFQTGGEFGWKPFDVLETGASYYIPVEQKPDGSLEDITYNARPYFSLTPINYVRFRVYVDNVFVRSTDKLERMIFGFLFSYNFSPKSWIYFALNDLRYRTREFDSEENQLPAKLQVTDRAAVFKIKYLYYF